jgi:hypothetical protein
MSGVENRLRTILQEAAPQASAVSLAAIERGARRRQRRLAAGFVLSVSSGAIAVCFIVVGALRETTSHAQAPPINRPNDIVTQDKGRDEYTQTAAWRDVGRQITQARRADPGLTHAIPVQLSAPIAVTKPGTYLMETGPVPASTRPGDVSMTLPPDITDHFILVGSPLHGMTFVHRPSGLFAQVHLRVTEVKAPYYHLTAWFQ